MFVTQQWPGESCWSSKLGGWAHLLNRCPLGLATSILSTEQVPLPGYVTFNSSDENPLVAGGLCYRDVTSPINDRDVESSSSSSRGECAPPRPAGGSAGAAVPGHGPPPPTTPCHPSVGTRTVAGPASREQG